MKKIIYSAILAILVVCGVAFSEYLPDVIVTSPNGIWTDTRAYSNLSSALTAIGSSERDIYIVREEVLTTLTIPSNAHLHFAAFGSITNSGQLSIQTSDINAGDHQIFTGTGEIDFAHGTNLRSTWFADLHAMFDLTLDNYVTCIITSGWAANIDADCQVGDNVGLKWEGPGNRLVINTGFTLSNIRNIHAGGYQIFAGSGDFDFADGACLRLSWFNRLRSALNWIETERAVIVVDGTHVVDYSDTATSNEYFDFESRIGRLDPNVGVTLTLYNPGNIIASPGQHIFGGLGDVAFTIPGVFHARWTGSTGDGSTDDSTDIEEALDFAGDGGTVDFGGGGLIYIIEGVSSSNSLYLVGDATLKAKAGSNNIDALTLTGINIDIDGLIFDGNKANQTTLTENQKDIVYISGTSNVDVCRAVFQNSVASGLYIYNSNRVKVSHVDLLDNGWYFTQHTRRSRGIGIRVEMCNDVDVGPVYGYRNSYLGIRIVGDNTTPTRYKHAKVHDSTILECLRDSTEWGIGVSVAYMEHAVITNTISKDHVGNCFDTNCCKYITFDGNQAIGSTKHNGFNPDYDDDTHSIAGGISTITNSLFAENYRRGLACQWASQNSAATNDYGLTTIGKNVFRRNGTVGGYGALSLTSGNGVIVGENIFTENDDGAAGSNHIWVSTAGGTTEYVTDHSFVNNIFQDGRGAASEPDYCIYIGKYPAGHANANEIVTQDGMYTDNIFKDYQVSALGTTATTPTNRKYKNCMIRDNIGAGHDFYQYDGEVANFTIDATNKEVIHLYNNGGNTVTSITGDDGQRITLMFRDNTTIIQDASNGSNMQLNGGVNVTPTVNDTLSLVYNLVADEWLQDGTVPNN